MARFRYKAIDASGKNVRDEITADSADQANEILSQRGMTPVTVTAVQDQRKRGGKSRVVKGSLKPEELILFTTQMATMLKAGIPILRVFEILQSESESKVLSSVCGAVGDDIRAGTNLYNALGKHPGIFPPLYRNMIRAGEASGTLPAVLQRLIYVITHEHKVRAEVRSVMQYPIMVLVVLFGSMGVLLTTVVPRFSQVYLNAGIELPLPTRICIALSNLLIEQWEWVLTGIAVLCVTFVVGRRTDKGRLIMDRATLMIPYVGDVIVKASLSRFAGVFSILQASGVSMLESIDILLGTLSNRAMVKEFAKVQRKVEHGQGLSRPLSQHPHFTPMFVSMVAIGEESGKLDEMLLEIANHYDEEVEFATKKLTAAIGPLLIVMLAAIVGFFALAVYMPMWDLAKIATNME